MNQLFYGDNLDILRRYIADESVDLVYLDPPFNSDQNYNVLFAEQDGTRSAAQVQAFEDTWQWDQSAAATYQEVVEAGGRASEALRALRSFLGDSDMLAYLSMMAPRLIELRRVLKVTGSLYLHCDPTASHYLKMLLDAIFGVDRFTNEIIWKRHNARSTTGRWPRLHDVLLVYAKSDECKFAPIRVPGDTLRIPHTLITGPDGQKYQTYELTGAGVTKEGESGRPWRGYDPSSMGRHWGHVHAQLDEWDAAGLIHWPNKGGSRGGFPRRRDEEPFVPEAREIVVGDVWTDIDRINQSAKERLGYPTQKPETLLERILLASSDVGGTVLDPFCGCGTTIAAAQKLGREWIGIDVTFLAISLIKNRLQDAFGDACQYKVVGEPTDLTGAKALADQDKYQFQWWALGLVQARPVEQKKGADRGIDGRILFHDDRLSEKTKQIIISVKGGGTSVKDVRDLLGVVTREKAEIGVLLTMQKPTKPMIAEAAGAGFYESPWDRKKRPRIQILTIEDLLSGKTIDMPPRQDIRTFKKAPKAKGKAKHRQPGLDFDE